MKTEGGRRSGRKQNLETRVAEDHVQFKTEDNDDSSDEDVLNPDVRRRRFRESERLRMRRQRASMTPEQKLAANEKARKYVAQRRLERRLERVRDPAEGREQYLAQIARERERRRRRAQEPLSAKEGTSDVELIPGESRGERSLRLERLRFQKLRLSRQQLNEVCTPNDSYVKFQTQVRITGVINKSLLTPEEKKMIKDKQNRKLATDNDDPEEEDERTWKEFFWHELKVEFQEEKNILLNEALDIELGPDVPSLESPLQDPNWLVNLANLPLKSLPRPQIQSESNAEKDTASQSDDDDDEAMEAIRNAFKEVEVKIEAEDYEEWDGNLQNEVTNQTNCDNDVADWIARVITGEEEPEGDDVTTKTGSGREPLFSSSTERGKHSTRAKSAAIKRFTNIISGTSNSSEKDSAMLRRWKMVAIRRREEEKLEKLRHTFLESRQRWVTSKPEDTEKRVKVDQERAELKESVLRNRKAQVETVIQELIHKRDIFSQETEQTRQTRIDNFHHKVASNINRLREERKRQKPDNEIPRRPGGKKPLSKEQKQKNVIQAALRDKMDKRAYEQHIDLLAAVGLPLPPPKFNIEPRRRKQMLESWLGEQFSVTRFEQFLKHGPYVESVLYYYDRFVVRTRAEVLSYRRLLGELVAKRRKSRTVPDNNAVPNPPAPEEEEEMEWITIPEAASLEDMEIFKTFITKYGDPVHKHLSYKRYYTDEKAKQYGHTAFCADPATREATRLKVNAYIRRMYIKKKYGVDLVPGEYFDKKTMSSVKKPPRVYVKKANKEGSGQTSPTRKDGRKSKESLKKKSALPKRRLGRSAKKPKPPSPPPEDEDSNSSSGADSALNESQQLPPVQNHEDLNADDSDDGWIPMASYEIECNTAANTPTSYRLDQQPQFLEIGRNSALNHHHHNLRSGTAFTPTQPQQLQNCYNFPNQVIQQYTQSVTSTQHQTPQFFTLVNHPETDNNSWRSSATQWNQSSTNVSSNRGQNQGTDNSPQYLQINPLVYSNPSQPQFQSTTSSITVDTQPEFDLVPTPTIEPEDASLQSAMEVNSLITSPITKSQGSLKRPHKRRSIGGRDIWNNRKRRKYYTNTEPNPEREVCSSIQTQIEPFESPFDRNPNETRDTEMLSHISLLMPKCLKCGAMFKDDPALERHISAVHKEAPAPPPPEQDSDEQADNVPVSLPNRLKGISAIWSNPNESMSCSICSMVVEGPAALIHHWGLTHFETGVWKCPFSSAVNSSTKYKRRPRDLTASALPCAKLRWKGESLKRHVVKVHPEKRPFSLSNHYATAYAKLRWCCIHCGIYLRMEDHWLDHVKLFHPEKALRPIPSPVEVEPEDGFHCDKCHSVFSAQSFLDQHKAAGHILLEGAPGKQKWNKKGNTRYHTFYKCEICPSSYTNLFSLRLHCFYSHELLKYLKSIKYPQSTEVELVMQIAKPTQEIIPSTKAVLEEIQTTKNPNPPGQRESQNSSDPLITCPICKTTGHNLHRIHKTYDKLMRRTCIPCNRLFSRPPVLRQHNEAEHGQAPGAEMTFPPPCGRISIPNKPDDCLECNCLRIFTPEEFHAHHILSEKDPDVRVCGICSKKFQTYNVYLRHIREEHGGSGNESRTRTKANVPPTNNKEPPAKRQLQEEDYEKLSCTTTLSLSEANVEIFSCRVCLKNFKTQAHIRAHIQESHADDAFTRVLCKKCNTTFANRNNLLKHERYHHRKNLVKLLCPVCDLPLARMDHLADHHKRFHPNSELDRRAVKRIPVEEAVQARNQVICQICSRNFANASGLKAHMTNYHFPTHFTSFCEICGLQCNPKTMRVHISTKHPGNEEQFITSRDQRAKAKNRICLLELIDLIQALWDKGGGIPEAKSRKRKPRTRTKKSEWSASETEESDQTETDNSVDEEDFDMPSTSDEDNDEVSCSDDAEDPFPERVEDTNHPLLDNTKKLVVLLHRCDEIEIKTENLDE